MAFDNSKSGLFVGHTCAGVLDGAHKVFQVLSSYYTAYEYATIQ